MSNQWQETSPIAHLCVRCGAPTDNVAVTRADGTGPYHLMCSAAQSMDEGTEHRNVWRHVATGRLYEIVCNAALESTKQSVVVYRSLSDGTTWVRDLHEFHDGRFVQLGK